MPIKFFQTYIIIYLILFLGFFFFFLPLLLNSFAMATSFANRRNTYSKSMRFGGSQPYMQEYKSNHIWAALWRRFTGAKKKNSEASSSSYDHQSYLQNFDEGSDQRVEAEYLSRSFSATYANAYPRFDHTVRG